MDQIGGIIDTCAPAYRNNYRKNSIESSEDQPMVEIPPVVDVLIDNKAYRPKFASLIAKGHLTDLIELAQLAPKMAKTKAPSHWFAVATAKANWKRTLDFLAKHREAERVAHEIAKRLGIAKEQMRVAYAAYWRLGRAVYPHVASALEVGRDKFKLFCYLVWKGGPPAYEA
jgi:hypothetical protein